MAIVHVNGFGTIPVAGDYVTPTNASSGTSTFSRQTGRYGGYALRHSNSTNGSWYSYAGKLRLAVPTGLEFSLGVAINHRATNTSASQCFGFYADSSSGNWEVSLGTEAANAYNNPSNTSAWSIVDGTLTSIGWHWWNWVFKSNATAGICQLYRDGTLIAQTGTDTTPYSAALPWLNFIIYLGNDNGGAQADFGDLIIKNDATTIADSVVTSLFVDGTTANAWVGSDGNSTDNHLLIDENPTYSAADYVGATTVGALDTYTVGNLPNTASSVHAVQVGARAFKSDAGAKTMRTRINSQNGTASDPGGGATIYQLATTSDGSTAWNTTSVNAMTASVEVVS